MSNFLTFCVKEMPDKGSLETMKAVEFISDILSKATISNNK